MFVVVVVNVVVVDVILDWCWEGFDDVIIIFVLIVLVDGDRGDWGELIGDIGDLGEV